MRNTSVKTPTVKFHDQVWSLLHKHSKGLTGEQVIKALEVASDKIWDLGFDEAYRQSVVVADNDLGNAFDFTWMTAFMLELQQYEKK